MGNTTNYTSSSTIIADRRLYNNSSGGLNLKLRASSSDAPGSWRNSGSRLDIGASHRAGQA